MKTFRTFLYLIIITMVTVNAWRCSPYEKENPGDTIIKGNIKFAKNQKMFLSGFADSISSYLDIKTVLDTALIDDLGNYRFSIHSSLANIYELRLADSVLITDLYLRPTDKLTFNFNGKYKDPLILSGADERNYNDFRLKLNRRFYFEPEIHQIYYISSNYMDVKAFDDFMHKRRQQMIAFYEDYFKDRKPDPAFDNYARSEISYQYGIDKLNYLVKKRIKNLDVFPDASYYKDITEKDYLNNAKAIGSPAYYHFLKLYIENLYGEKMAKHEIVHQGPGYINPPAEKYKLAIHYLSGSARDIELYIIIVNDMSKAEWKTFANRSVESLTAWFKKKYPELIGV
jgi:hypothetical protein